MVALNSVEVAVPVQIRYITLTGTGREANPLVLGTRYARSVTGVPDKKHKFKTFYLDSYIINRGKN